MSQNLPSEIRAELAHRVDQLVGSGMDRALARRKVWDEYQDELVNIANQMHGAAEPAPPELPPPKHDWPQAQDLSRHGNKPLYQARPDSGNDYWTPERKAKSLSELGKLKEFLRMK